MRAWAGSIQLIVADMGGCMLFLGEVYRRFYALAQRRHLVFDQIYQVTLQSLATTALAGFFVGAIMTVQFTLQAKSFGALGFLGGLATSATFREVGPLLIAFMLSGKVGAYTAAELATMKVTEQIDAIRCLGADPIVEIILPRFVGIIIASFFLLLMGLIMSTVGGTLLAIMFSGVSVEEYLRHIPTILNPLSVLSGVFKCAVFAFTLAAICTYKGYTATGGARGVGRAVVNTAVATMIGIVLTDWLTSYILDQILKAFILS